MADTNETVADIIAEKRREANYIVQVAQGKCHTRRDKAEDEARDIRRDADRLEAAHKREKAEWVNANARLAKLVDIEKVGDCAKLHEALEELVANIEMRSSTFGLNVMVDTKTFLDAKAALAAPARNCDKFGSSTQARAEWYKTEVLPRVEGVVSGVEPPFVDWLFAPATEHEGGNDGNE